jgi:putative ABC transport system ATP-binding protein
VEVATDLGDFIAIWRPSYNCKSSPLDLLGLIRRPTEGQLIVNRSNVERMSDDELAELRGRTIGFALQNLTSIWWRY